MLKSNACSLRPMGVSPHNFHMGLMIDAEESCRLQEAHGCQAMPIYGSWLAETLALTNKSGPICMPFVVMKPYQLPPDPLISFTWVWWVMRKSGAGSWRPMGVRPCQMQLNCAEDDFWSTSNQFEIERLFRHTLFCFLDDKIFQGLTTQHEQMGQKRSLSTDTEISDQLFTRRCLPWKLMIKQKIGIHIHPRFVFGISWDGFNCKWQIFSVPGLSLLAFLFLWSMSMVSIAYSLYLYFFTLQVVREGVILISTQPI
jgi:hypothetical protein